MENNPVIAAPSEPNGLIATIRSLLKPFALGLKLATVLVLVVLLQIPLLMVRGLLLERQERCSEAVREITETWGRAQEIAGPVLVVPYRASRTVERETIVNGRAVCTTEDRTAEAYACFLPEALTIVGTIDPSMRYRGIYEAIVYTSHLKISGKFSALDPKSLGIDPSVLQWDRAWLSFGISDLRGTRKALQVVWDGKPLNLLPGAQLEGFDGGLHANLSSTELSGQNPAPEHRFELDLTINGSTSLHFSPLAVQTTVNLQSPWADPSFSGAFLPTDRSVDPSGFNASWNVPYYGRDLSQQWRSEGDRPAIEGQKLRLSHFGVELIKPVDTYRSVERATKHGALFLTLIFTAFFLFEILSALRLHALHYLLVGAALCLFYLGLLSLSEFIAFPVAYIIAAAASTALIGLYCRSILKSGPRSLIVAAVLGGIYAFLYFVLQMQDYALLAGTTALFIVLAAVMYATRRVEWSKPAS